MAKTRKTKLSKPISAKKALIKAPAKKVTQVPTNKLIAKASLSKKVGAPSKGPSPFTKGARRGRRPKGSTEYTPEHQAEDHSVAESNYEGLEYDTGIRINKSRDDGGFSLERIEDFDEELNFDW